MDKDKDIENKIIFTFSDDGEYEFNIGKNVDYYELTEAYNYLSGITMAYDKKQFTLMQKKRGEA